MAERVDIGCKRLQIDGGPRPARLRKKLRRTEQDVYKRQEYDHSKDLIKNFSADFARYPIEKRNRNQRANIFHPFR